MVKKNGLEKTMKKDPYSGILRPVLYVWKNGKIVEQHWLSKIEEEPVEPKPEITFIADRINSGFDDEGEMVDFEYEWNSKGLEKLKNLSDTDKITVQITENDDEGRERESETKQLTKKEILDLVKNTKSKDYEYF